MAILSITASAVLKGANAQFQTGLAGATITAGQTVYLDAADSTYKLADANLSAAAATVVAIALNSASAGQPVSVLQEDDDFTTGGTMVTGTVYVLSATAGGINPAADLAAGWYPSVVFIAKSTTKAVMKIVNQVSAVV